MNINEFDSNFNKDEFISKIDNIFVMLFTSFMMKDLARVSHNISNNVRNKFQNELNILNKENKRQMYEQLNVKNTYINSFEVIDDKIYIDTTIIGRYYDYIMNDLTKENITNPRSDRSEVNYKCIFVKNLHAKKQGIVRYCPNCGMHMDVNYSGKCSYCGSIYNTKDYDYILNSIEVI